MLRAKGWLVFASLVFLGCTRPEQSSTFRISIPQSKPIHSQATGSLEYVAINVSGPGIEPTKVMIWERPAINAPVPEYFVVEDLTSGKDRLIQLLAVYGNSQGLSFFYADQTAELASGPNEILLTLSQIDSGNGSGHIHGRYFTSTGQTPTGKIHIKYYPPNGAPGMLVNTANMMAGWFSAIVLADLELYYEMQDHGLLFGGPVKLGSPILNNAQVLRVGVPLSYWSGNPDPIHPETFAVGFFGNPPAGKAACKSIAYSYMNRQISQGGPGLSYPGDFSVSGPSNFCTGTDFIDFVTFYPQVHDKSGKDAVAGFNGPFSWPSNSTSGLLTYGSMGLSWDYLPGVKTEHISGVRVLARPASVGNNDYRGRNGPDCAKLSALGFVPVADIPFPQKQVNFSAFPDGTFTTIICPHKEGKYLNAALEGIISKGQAPGGPPTQMVFRKINYPEDKLLSFQCTQLRIELQDDNGIPTVSPTPVAFGLQVTATSPTQISVHANENDCSGQQNALTNPIQIPPQTSAIIVWIQAPSKASNPAGVEVALIDDPDAPSLSTPPSFNFSVKDSWDNQIIANGSPILFPDTCLPVNFRYTTYALSPISVATPTTFNISSGSDLTFYDDSSCTSAANLGSFPQFTDNAQLYAIYSGAVSSTTVTLTPQSGDNFETSTITFFRGTGSPSVSQLMFADGYTTFQNTQCAGPFTVFTLNDGSSLFPVPTTTSINLSTNPGGATFYSDSSCVNPPPTNIPAGETSFTFYMKQNAVGPTQLTATAGSASGQLSLIMDGIHSLSIGPTLPPPYLHGACLALKIEPRLYTGGFTYPPSPLSGTLSGFGGNVFSDIDCTLPTSTFTIPAMSSATVYARLLNNSSSPANFTGTATASGLVPGTLSISIEPAPQMAKLDSSNLDIAAEYPFDLSKLIVPFTGVPPYNYSKTGGSGSLAGSVYTPGTHQDTPSFQIVDSNAPISILNVNYATVARTANLDFTSSLPSGATLSRSTGAYYYDSSGVLTWAAADTPRFDHDPTTHQPKGLLIEPASNNLLLWTEDLTQIPAWLAEDVSVTASSENSPTGSTTGVFLVQDTSGVEAGAIRQDFSLSFSVNHFMSVYVKNSNSSAITLKFTDGISWATVTQNQSPISLVADNSASFTNYKYGSQALNNGWYRIWLAVRPSSSGTASFIIYPSNQAVADTGAIHIFGPQVEYSENLSSYIPSAGTGGFRDTDLVMLPVTSSDIPGLSSTSTGSFSFQFSLPPGGMMDNRYLFAFCISFCADSIVARYEMFSNGLRIETKSSSMMGAYFLAKGLSFDADNRLNLAWGPTNPSVTVVTNGHFNFSPDPITPPDFLGGYLYLGNNDVNGGPSHLWIKTIEYWPSKLTQGSLRSF